MLIRIQEDSLRTSDDTLILIPHFKEWIIRLILQGTDRFPKEFEVATKHIQKRKTKHMRFQRDRQIMMECSKQVRGDVSQCTMYWFGKTAITKYHKVGGLNKRNFSEFLSL